MPRIAGDFSQISSTFENLDEGEYRFQLDEIEDKPTKDGKPQLLFKSKVVEGPKLGSVFTDFVVLRKNDGGVNNIGMGRIKAYAEAIIGQEAANNPEGIDTDELRSGTFIGVIKHESYEGKNADGSSAGQKTAARLSKILRAD